MKSPASEESIFIEFPSEQGILRVPIEFHLRKNIGGRKDLLARAVGFKKGHPLGVLDLTAGLGRDAFHLASLGCRVVALERNPLVAEALQKAWKLQGREEPLTFIHSEAKDYLDHNHAPVDVIYYDPIFPAKSKSALAGKESQLLQYLSPRTEKDEKSELLLAEQAFQQTRRLVIKRPLRAGHLLRRPDIEFKGKSIRYDVYLKK